MNTATSTRAHGPALAVGRSVRALAAVVLRYFGAFVTVAGLVGWLGWLSWRFGAMQMTVVSLLVLVLELVAFSAALVVSAGLWAGRPGWRRARRADDAQRQLPVLLAEALDLGEIVHEDDPGVGTDDTGEIAWARRGIRVLGDQRRLDARTKVNARNLREAAWSVVAVDGLRRLLAVVALIVVLFSGSAPFDSPPAARAWLLGGGIALLSIGHWMMSGGHVRPGSRLLWSMSSIGAGLGDGISRSGLPIRWVMTMATLVALNISVALRGMSDRWTHGLGPMAQGERVAAMSLALAFVAAGGLALHRMPRPELDFYGATRRLEETSVRRLALGLTLVVAVIGFVAGVMPDATAVAAP